MSSLSVCTRVLVTAATVTKGECTCSANSLAREISFVSISAIFLAQRTVHRAKRNVRTGTLTMHRIPVEVFLNIF